MTGGSGLVGVEGVQYSTVQYTTVQYSTVHYSTVQYSGSPDVAGGSGLLGVEGVQVQQVHEVGQTPVPILGTQARAEEENGLMHVLLFCK